MMLSTLVSAAAVATALPVPAPLASAPSAPHLTIVDAFLGDSSGSEPCTFTAPQPE